MVVKISKPERRESFVKGVEERGRITIKATRYVSATNLGREQSTLSEGQRIKTNITGRKLGDPLLADHPAPSLQIMKQAGVEIICLKPTTCKV